MKNIIKNIIKKLFTTDGYNSDDVCCTYYVCPNCNDNLVVATLLPIIDKEKHENNSILQTQEKIELSQFLNFLFASRTNGTFGFALHTLLPDNSPYLH